MKNCKLCELCKIRKNVVLPDGPENARLMIVGEAPGAQEDESGKPFVGLAGRKLTRIMEEEGLNRKDAFITNIVRCRPPNNRRPNSREVNTCKRFLFESIEKLRPEIICTLGATSSQFLLKSRKSISDLQGKFYPFQGNKCVIRPTFHPSYLNRCKKAMRLFRADMKAIAHRLLE